MIDPYHRILLKLSSKSREGFPSCLEIGFGFGFGFEENGRKGKGAKLGIWVSSPCSLHSHIERGGFIKGKFSRIKLTISTQIEFGRMSVFNFKAGAVEV